MREILFRGKLEHGGAWVSGSLIHVDLPGGSFTAILQPEENVHPNDFPYLCRETGCIDGNADIVCPDTVGQYTGLKDKDGHKIFEGDLVLCDRNIAPSVDKRVFQIIYDPVDGFTAESWSSCITMESHDLMEIVGNIHDNPELWEVKR